MTYKLSNSYYIRIYIRIYTCFNVMSGKVENLRLLRSLSNNSNKPGALEILQTKQILSSAKFSRSRKRIKREMNFK